MTDAETKQSANGEPGGEAEVMVSVEPAIVYRAAGRRWLTLKGACSAAARRRLLENLKDSGDEWDSEWYTPRHRRLTCLYLRAFKKEFTMPKKEGQSDD
jgi:hypothetical protein